MIIELYSYLMCIHTRMIMYTRMKKSFVLEYLKGAFLRRTRGLRLFSTRVPTQGRLYKKFMYIVLHYIRNSEPASFTPVRDIRTFTTRLLRVFHVSISIVAVQACYRFDMDGSYDTGGGGPSVGDNLGITLRN